MTTSKINWQIASLVDDNAFFPISLPELRWWILSWRYATKLSWEFKTEKALTLICISYDNSIFHYFYFIIIIILRLIAVVTKTQKKISLSSDTILTLLFINVCKPFVSCNYYLLIIKNRADIFWKTSLPVHEPC